MPRRPRIVVAGVPHRVTQRGNNRQAVFSSADDRRFYLERLTRHGATCGTHVIGYCLMTNHVHLIVVSESERCLARTLGQTHAEYAQAVNQAECRSGHLWQNRFFSCPLDAAHLQSALLYVDLNPVRAGLAAVAWEWPWSSARAHSLAGANDPVLDPAWGDGVGGWDFAAWKLRLGGGLSEDECAALRNATLPFAQRLFMSRRKAGGNQG